jgi:hypothetical protein
MKILFPNSPKGTNEDKGHVSMSMAGWPAKIPPQNLLETSPFGTSSVTLMLDVQNREVRRI